MASKIGSARFIASSRPEVRSVIAPSAARAGPPLVGASTKARPDASTFSPMRRAWAGSIVTQDMMSASGAVEASTPPSPNRTASHCAALTTMRMTTSAPEAASCEEPAALPELARKTLRRRRIVSAPTTAQPFRAETRGDAIANGAQSDDGDRVRFHGADTNTQGAMRWKRSETGEPESTSAVNSCSALTPPDDPARRLSGRSSAKVNVARTPFGPGDMDHGRSIGEFADALAAAAAGRA